MAVVSTWLVLAAIIWKTAVCLDTEVVVLRAMRGREARLPCGQGRVFLDGPDAYVMWLKDERDLLYRFPNDATKSADRIFSSNCNGEDCHDETALTIKRVSEQDGGMYRCRVHYQASPSVDYGIEVRIVESPGVPRIYMANGSEVTQGFVGPLAVGSNLSLTCEVQGTDEDTLVYWRRDGRVAERARVPGPRRATLRLLNASRADLDARIDCVAQNADVTEPLASSLVVKINLPPLSVEIRLNNNPDFEAGQPRMVDCVVVGCVPPPSISWHLGDTMLRPTVHKELHDGNYTVSSLSLAPSLRDNARDLVCRAHNSLLPERVFEDRIKLNIGYRPICVSQSGETIGVVINEAESATCTVEAWPEPLQFAWTFADTRTLYTSVKKVSGHHNRYTSTLTWQVRSGDAGALRCRATNAFGEQKRACVFEVAAGRPPLPPTCVVLRSAPDALRVECAKGWDGGRPQTVHLELLDSSGRLLHNMTDAGGRFLLAASEQRNLTARVYASSVRGVSAKKVLHLYGAAPLTASVEPKTGVVVREWVVWVQSAVAAVSLFSLVTFAGMCVRARRARLAHSDPELVPSRSDGTFHREPDFTRDERVLGTTNITVNQHSSCPRPIKYSATPIMPCRVMVGCSPECGQQSYFV